ncbi:hypothetical protein GCM10009838_74200 [Catenulispora subtropica]|uniref:Uncharacterized protein n=1 Tax=Catenulispora subtropica TaxID=450798 RepID=A0ABN2T4E0_9ACTN
MTHQHRRSRRRPQRTRRRNRRPRQRVQQRRLAHAGGAGEGGEEWRVRGVEAGEDCCGEDVFDLRAGAAGRGRGGEVEGEAQGGDRLQQGFGRRGEIGGC